MNPQLNNSSISSNNSPRWAVWYLVCDMLAILLAWVSAYILRFVINFPNFGSGFEIWYLALIPVVVASAPFCFWQAKMYQSRSVDIFDPGKFRIIRGVLYHLVLILAAAFFLRSASFSRFFAVYFFLFSILYLLIGRIVLNRFRDALLKKLVTKTRLLIVGSGKTAEILCNRLQARDLFDIELIGVIGENKDQQVLWLGGFEQISSVIQESKIDRVVLALDWHEKQAKEVLLKKLSEESCDICDVPDLYETLFINPILIDLAGVPMMVLRQSPLGWGYNISKRIFDLVGSIMALILFSPLIILIALLVKLTSPGPVFYRQTRAGLDGEVFDMLKFRSMKIDAETKSGAVWAKKDDDRTTWLGKFLRKTSLDELPQFLNVLAGDMSLVGPRPERPVFVNKFRTEIPHYMIRHKVKTGITGWAQINGWRGDTSLEKRIECDLYYIANWSLIFDLKILLLTPFKGFIHKNAY